MPIPLIIAAAVALTVGYGAKKGFDGYQSHSEADEIVDRAKRRYNDKKASFDNQEKTTQKSLEELGDLELDIGTKFNEFSTLVKQLLEKLNQGRQDKIEVNFPKHQLEKIENYTFTAIGVLGSAAGAGAAGAAAGFAIYGGVMTFAAASTGTAISALSGVAATNATLAAIGGGALSAGGLGMAGGTAILGAAVAAPVLAIAAWAYASHGEEALNNARKARNEADKAIEKLGKAEQSLQRVEQYAGMVHMSLDEIYNNFKNYLETLRDVHQRIERASQLKENFQPMNSEVLRIIRNGYKLAAILTNIITTPLFKVQIINNLPVQDKDGIPVMEKDEDGSMILNEAAINKSISEGSKQFSDFSHA